VFNVLNCFKAGIYGAKTLNAMVVKTEKQFQYWWGRNLLSVKSLSAL
jgi:hypothetical protein